MDVIRKRAFRAIWTSIGRFARTARAEPTRPTEPETTTSRTEEERPPLVGDLCGGASEGQATYAMLSDIAQAKPLDRCLEDFDGFAPLASGEHLGRPIEILEFPTMLNTEWVFACNARTSRTPDVGCLFATSASIYGPGHVLIDGALLIEDIELSAVAKEWHEKSRPGLPDRELLRVQEPVIAFLGPGHKVYGHWIVDYLPRLFVAKTLLGDAFRKFSILLPSNTPDFAQNMCRIFIGEDLRFRFYDEDRDFLVCDRVCIPTSPSSYDHHFPKIVSDLFEPHQARALGTRKICISRKKIEGRTPGVAKVFPQLKVFEATAELHGYEIVHPEDFALEEQFEIFRQARVVVGQYGSGLHNSIFCAPGAIIGAAGFFNAVQLRLCLMSDQTCAFVTPSSESYLDGVITYTCDTVSIAEFFKVIDAAIAARPLVTDDETLAGTIVQS